MAATLDDRTMRRIVALLVSFAVMAERAAGRSFPVRFVVLCILRHAEAVALLFVAETFEADVFYVHGDPETGYGPADAMAIAMRLRALASLVFAMLDPADLDDGWVIVLSRRALRSDARACLTAPFGWIIPCIDTS
ncbi:hypothetical protein [Aquibium oceanicum]|uniref:Uncharacterized protein n=1 Tax=Aquibium oceanicum TaxID=1670800 RepID=A0A1L3SSE3_9HYPH|nr:hypothetical protein [Aquibium oceanicum]APH72304.1 hypothetical protein BSQ44_13725 [Aquibium oceanicum]